jgi:hypothetical protein
VCYRVIDLGTQDSSYKGEPKKTRLIMIAWELPDERMEDGRPFMVSRRFTYSASENSHLRKALESWRGKAFTSEEIAGFDLSKMLKATALLSLSTEENAGKTYQNILTISQPLKGQPRTKDTENEAFCFAMAEGMFNMANFAKLHEKLQEIIKKSPEFQAMSKGQPASAASSASQEEMFEDEIPFNLKLHWSEWHTRSHA